MKATPLSFLYAALALLLVRLPSSQGQPRAGAVPPSDLVHAVVRIPSHGASATVIATAPGRSYLLSCGHAFQGPDRYKAIAIDTPTTRPLGMPQAVGIHVVDVDETADLSLLVLQAGPLEFVAPVAPAGHQPSRHLWSVGFDEMRLPVTRRPATLLGMSFPLTFTAERPWHGRSGGALLDLDAGYLVGVVSGYEVNGERRGLYVSQGAILRFLSRQSSPSPSRERPARPCPPRG